jgi:hypothetical protein
MKSVQRKLAEGLRQPRQFFHLHGRVGQISGKHLRQLSGKMTARGPEILFVKCLVVARIASKSFQSAW